MSASLIPEAQKTATEEQTSIQKMLIENGRLIESIAEYQRLGRPAEAMKYQELLHRNLLYLGSLVDPQLEQQIQNIRVQPVVEPPPETQQPVSSTQSGPPSQQQPVQSQPGIPSTAANTSFPSPQQQPPNVVMNGSMMPPQSQQQPYPINGQQGMPPNGPGMMPPQHSIPPPMHSQTPPTMGIPPQQYPPQ